MQDVCMQRLDCYCIQVKEISIDKDSNNKGWFRKRVKRLLSKSIIQYDCVRCVRASISTRNKIFSHSFSFIMRFSSRSQNNYAKSLLKALPCFPSPGPPFPLSYGNWLVGWWMVWTTQWLHRADQGQTSAKPNTFIHKKNIRHGQTDLYTDGRTDVLKDSKLDQTRQPLLVDIQKLCV